MKFFKHGDALAIVLPESLRARSAVKEGDEFEWFEAEPGVFVLASKDSLTKLVKQTSFDSFLEKISERKATQPAPAVTRFGARAEAKKTEFKETAAPVFKPAAKGFAQQLYSQGYVVLSNEADAKALSDALAQEIRAGAVIGVRGFDKKYYVATREFFESASEKVRRALGSKEATVTQISAVTKAPLEACLTVLYVMKECGELVEKRRGCFSLIK